MLNRIFKSGLIGFFALVTIFTFTSCQKDKATIGIVIVKNSIGAVVSNAEVTLSPEQEPNSSGEMPNPLLTKSKWTDASGQAEFDYDLEAILNIEVVKYEGNDTLQGINIIRLETGQSITKVVEIN